MTWNTVQINLTTTSNLTKSYSLSILIINYTMMILFRSILEKIGQIITGTEYTCLVKRVDIQIPEIKIDEAIMNIMAIEKDFTIKREYIWI